MQQSKSIILAIALLTGLLLQGCAAVIVGGAATTASVAHDRRTAGVIVEDQSIELKSMERLGSDTTLDEHSKISITSYNMVVLLTGQTETEAIRARAEQMVKGIERVRRVVNELEIGTAASIGERARDSALTTEVKFKLTGVDLPDFDTFRVKVVTERGVVFLMGILTQAEGDAVTDLVRHISGVRRVVRVFEYI
ncbi:BON domain-containing protein [endosymbiont of Lamellibrachia barhami]|uniref:BON domain-containing protein n=1 Tax=endosymbiont of Lamellibrachia barhami TaxID=205975 RepID=UPI0015A77A8F|nr:BON domain-containing protein [endosymbiont of Lamellibrachia barhami]